MSKRFDPEKVERTRWVAYYHEGYSPCPNDPADADMGDFPESVRVTVEASDYDKLLALYRELQRQFNTGMNDSRAARTQL